MNPFALLSALALAPSFRGAAAPVAQVTVHVDRPVGRASPWLFGCSLPAPGTPGADALLPDLLRNGSFETAPEGKHEPLPESWGRPRGWELLSFGSTHVLVRRELGLESPLVLVGRRHWPGYRLSLLARKIDGPGGLAVLVEVRDEQNHVRWTLGANGNTQHVLESVGEGQPRLLEPPVAGRIEPGRCYRVEIERAAGVLRCSLDGRLIHRVGEARFPSSGIGLGAADATAEYLDLTVRAPGNRLMFLLDNPTKATPDVVASGWEPLCAPENRVTYRWDPIYPLNSRFSQNIRVESYGSGDAGVRQSGVPIEASLAYRGRLHLRSSERTLVTVSLRGRDGRVYARATLGTPTNAWKPYDFALRPSASDPSADFCITVAGVADVWVDQVSLRADDPAGFRALRGEAIAQLRELRPTLLRWPAGPAVIHYNWLRGVGPPETRQVTCTSDGARTAFEAASNDFGTDEFLALCRRLGAEPLLAVNPVLGAASALDWLEYCNGDPDTSMGKLRAANGHREPYGVRLWAIGAEPPRGSSPALPPSKVAEIAKAMQQADPKVRLLAASTPVGAGAQREDQPTADAGPLLSHVAKGIEWPADGAGRAARVEGIAFAARSLRSHSLSLAVTDWNVGADPALLPHQAALLLRALARDGGPEAIATWRYAPLSREEYARVQLLSAPRTVSPAQAAFELLRANRAGELVQAEANVSGGAQPLDVVAGKEGNKVILWLISSAEQEVSVRIAVDGLGQRRLAPRATHWRLEGVGPGALAPASVKLAVQGNELAVTLKGRDPVHVVVLQLEGG